MDLFVAVTIVSHIRIMTETIMNVLAQRRSIPSFPATTRLISVPAIFVLLLLPTEYYGVYRLLIISFVVNN